MATPNISLAPRNPLAKQNALPVLWECHIVGTYERGAMRRVLFLGLVVLVAVALVGCSGGDLSTTTGQTAGIESTASSTSSTAGSESTSTTTSEADSLEWPMLAPTVIDVPTEEVVNVVISPAGGVVEYGPVKVEVPAGAVASETRIVITRLTQPFQSEPSPTDDPNALSALPISCFYDFGPAGLRFDVPVTVTLPYDAGMGPDGVDAEQVAITYWDGERWMAVKGTVDPEERTVSVEVPHFEGSVIGAVVIGGIVGTAVHFGIKWLYGNEYVNSDPVVEGKAQDYVRPNDPTIAKWAGRAMLENPVTKEVKGLDDPDLAAWIAEAAANKQKPTLVYKPSEGTIFRTDFSDQDGSNWQTPDHYFGNGTYDLGPVSGDCTDQTNIGVSIFKNKGFKAKAIYSYGDGDKRRPHVYGEVLIGDTVYRIDEYGALITKESDPNNFKSYQPITDPDDPHYNCMWDEKGQEPYDELWTMKGDAFEDFVGTYKGSFPGGDPYGEIPFGFTVDETGGLEGGIDFSKSLGGNWTATFTGSLKGSVFQDGRVEAKGLLAATVPGSKTGTVTSGVLLQGMIAEGIFTGTLTGDDEAIPVTARRQ